jgi:BASS family bile acid:Na+ symporter
MTFSRWPVAFLEWLGRQGTTAVAVSILLGILLPPLGALMRPFFAETVVALLVLAFLRVEPAALRAQFARPQLVAAAFWTMAALPVLVGLGLLAAALHDHSPGLVLALMLNAVAPPVFSAPALAVLMGLNPAVSLALVLVCTAAAPFLAPPLVATFAGPAVTFSPVELGLRLVLMLAGAACAALAIRAVAGRAWVERQATRIDGLAVIVLFAFAVALMGNVLADTLAQPLLVLGLIALSFAVSLALSALTALAFLRTGWRTALPLAHAAGSRNMGLMLAAAAGAVPELVWLYIALAQLPIYLLPLLLKPLLRRLPAG